MANLLDTSIQRNYPRIGVKKDIVGIWLAEKWKLSIQIGQLFTIKGTAFLSQMGLLINKDAHSVFDLLIQGKFFLPVVRDAELAAAYRLMRRHMAVKKRVHRLRNQIRGALHLAFPELNGMI